MDLVSESQYMHIKWLKLLHVVSNAILVSLMVYSKMSDIPSPTHTFQVLWPWLKCYTKVII